MEHRRKSSVNFRGHDIFAPNYVWKINKCPNFTQFLPEKLTKFPNFTWFLPEKYFPEFLGGGPPVSYDYVLKWQTESRQTVMAVWELSHHLYCFLVGKKSKFDLPHNIRAASSYRCGASVHGRYQPIGWFIFAGNPAVFAPLDHIGIPRSL